MESYEPRAFRFIELLAIGDWKMKLYGITWRKNDRDGSFLKRPEE